MSKLLRFISDNRKKSIIITASCVVLCAAAVGILIHTNDKNNKTKENKVVLTDVKKEEPTSKTTEADSSKENAQTEQAAVKPESQFVEQKFTGKTTEVVNFRENPSDTETVISKLKQRTIVEVLGKQQDWYKVKYDSKEGWINSKYLNEYTADDKKADEDAEKKQQEALAAAQKSEEAKKAAATSNASQANPSTINNTQPATPAPEVKKGFKSPQLSNSSQIILVTTSSMSSSYANIKFYQKNGDDWTIKTETNGRVGSNGLAYISNRMQSTDKTPAGVLGILGAFGVSDNPGCKYSYTKVTDNMYWDLNSGSSTYNRLIYSNPGGDYEHLASYPTHYKYALITDYNVNQTANKGGGIFVHVNGSGGTAGCVSMPEAQVKDLITWVNPTKNPKILIIPISDLGKYWY
ncbi:SH3 domain-containing protein [Clostridium sp. YIM B02505]|uniref:SH3 domain-containing protein n=1 Tax=Clostridium yunnanense TaxID=2800325 RepID=A0ABS1EUI5_9CLOT|nr:SH3 domain-containing protein [Clostridium yunnanense]MBK1813052.1 SH3 domain-containing protein [Clostridium yunnanense]